MKKHMPTIMVVVMLMFGFGMLFYPDISTWYNSRIQAGLVEDYYRDVGAMLREQIEEEFRRAEEHNAVLRDPNRPFAIYNMADIPDGYFDVFNVGRGSVMGRIEIPIINVNLPIFHTARHDVLERGAGHLEGTALPIGGYGNHAAITAHSALPNARMFTDLEGNVTYGDLFFITILDRRLAYEVIQIDEVYPHEIELLRPVPGQDLVTLITCTPYAINSHRLLVRGRRVPYIPAMADEIDVQITVTSVDVRVFIFIAFFMLFILVFAAYHLIAWVTDPGVNGARSRPNRYAEAVAVTTATGATATPKHKPVPVQNPIPVKATSNAKPLFNPTHKPHNPNMSKNIAACIIALVVIVGVGIGVSQLQNRQPSIQESVAGFVARIEEYRATHTDRLVAEMIERWQASGEVGAIDADMLDATPLSWLYNRLSEHNRFIYETGQGSLPDPFSYSQPASSLSYFGFDEEMIGFITIPRIDIELPIYMGSSRENLHRGLAHLTNSSLPIGGTNTNAIIAGHMNIGRTNILNGVSSLTIGDTMEITNFYETLTYTIIDIQQIHPHQTDLLKVQSGRDLVTLLVYQPDNPQRHMVLAQRSG